ncbi:N-terminal glutamine amidase-domain-containing protein, partial [Gorgonomyces haynaldii]
YQRCYCEENIYKLLELEEDAQYCVFISNKARKVPFWDPIKDVVVWDYHVIACGKGKVFDLDSSLPIGCHWKDYVRHVLGGHQLPEEYQRMYRIVEKQAYLDTLSSDRSHMLRDGKYIAEPPAWECI